MSDINGGFHKSGMYEWGKYKRKHFSVKCLQVSRHVTESYLFTICLLRIYLYTVYFTTLLVDHIMVATIHNERSKNDVQRSIRRII